MYEVTYFIGAKCFCVYCSRFDDCINLLTSRFKSIDWFNHYVKIQFVDGGFEK